MMIRPDSQFTPIPYISGSACAVGGSIVGTVVDLAPYEGNVMVQATLASGTGTLSLIVQHGTVNTVFATIGTQALFTASTGGTLASGTVSLSNAASGTQTFMVNTDKSYRFLRFLMNSAGSVPAVSITAIAPNKYANWS